MAPRTNVYVDGFNLYFSIRRTPYKWLNLARLFDVALPKNDIQRVRYFTARIKARPDDPMAPTRQLAYLKALESEPRVSIHLGQFLASKTRMRLVNPPPPPAGATVEVHKMEEKGSDVNLATYMLTDAFDNDCDVSVLVSNDSDLALPMRMVSQRFGHPIGLVNPNHRIGFSKKLRQESPAFMIDLRPSALAAAQFPDSFMVGDQVVTKPAGW